MYLLDTHALVRAIDSPERLSSRVKAILGTVNIQASVVWYWELALKRGRASALVLHPFEWWHRNLTDSSVEVLPIRVSHVDRLDGLAQINRDPFDRMLIAQALAEGCTLVSKDGVFASYGASVVWD